VSTAVILQHIHDLGGLTQHQLRESYERELVCPRARDQHARRRNGAS
jgi:hypothetical protein